MRSVRRAEAKKPTGAEIPEIVGYLAEHLSPQVTAYLSGIEDPRLVMQWAAGEARPAPLSRSRLCSAYEATRHIVDAYGDETAQMWFFGTNPVLGDEAPAYVLRHGESPEDWRFVIPAAQEFAETWR